MIEPTVGRVVLYRTRDMDEHSITQSLAAIVTYVWNVRCVNLAVFHPNGTTYPQTSVLLLQDDDRPHGEDAYCEWMPYQIGQAKKNA